MKKSFAKKTILVLLALSLISSGIFAEEKVLTWEDQKLEIEARIEARKAAREQAAKARLEAKLAKMTPEKRAEFEAKEAEKKAALDAKQADKERIAAEKKVAKEAATAERQAAKEAATQEKLAAMTPEQKAKYDEKEALKAKLKAEIEADKAMRKETLEKTAIKPVLPYMYFDCDFGLDFVDVTRVVLKNDRSNFIFNDNLLGVSATMKVVGFKPFIPLLKVTGLMGTGSTFNDMKVTTSTFNYGVDLFAGLDYRISCWDYLFINLAPGFHLLYQDTDRFGYLNLGIGTNVSFELPVSYEFTVILGGQASYDWGNFGNNALLETYDYVWQYGATLGVRFSKQHVNKYNYTGDSAELIQIKKDRKKALKAELQAKKDAKKAAAAEAKAAKGASQQ